MPKVQVDAELLRDLTEVVRTRFDGCASRAAVALGLDRSSLWRFLRDGRAILETRNRYRKALLKLQQERTSDDAVSVALSGVASDRELRASIPQHELERIRQTGLSLLALVRSYESQRNAVVAEPGATGDQ